MISRQRAIVIGVAVALVVLVGAIVLLQGDDETSPSSAGTDSRHPEFSSLPPGSASSGSTTITTSGARETGPPPTGPHTDPPIATDPPNSGFKPPPNVKLNYSVTSDPPDHLSFGRRAVDAGPVVRRITYTNTGAKDISIQRMDAYENAAAEGIDSRNAFSPAGSTCHLAPAVLAPGATCYLDVSFDPPEPGGYAGDAQLVYGPPNPDSSTTFSVVNINLDGEGIVVDPN